MSSTTTTSNLSPPNPSDLKYSIIDSPFSAVRTVPRTVKPLSRRVRTTHMARYPLAPETRTLDPLLTEGIVCVSKSWDLWMWTCCVSQERRLFYTPRICKLSNSDHHLSRQRIIASSDVSVLPPTWKRQTVKWLLIVGLICHLRVGLLMGEIFL